MSAVTILLAILVFGIMIFVHESGHFLTAKWSGIKVNEFALGMGPVLLKFQRGETQYALRLFPIGGFVAMEGENEESGNERAFCNAKLYKRIIVTVAGACMNLLLGLVLLGFLSFHVGLGSNVINGDSLAEGTPSYASFQDRDQIVRMDGHRVRTRNDIVYELTRTRDGRMEIELLRDGEAVVQTVQFNMVEQEGIAMPVMDFEVYGLQPTLLNRMKHTVNWTASVVKQVWGSLVDLVTGRYSLGHLSGPVAVTGAISDTIGDAISEAKNEPESYKPWITPIYFMAMITVNLGVFNLLPVPALDGGRLLFLLIELVRRKPINPKYEGYVHATGLLLLLGLMAVVTVNDIFHLF